MEIVTYTPEHFARLAAAARTAPAGRSLCHRPFVDYYYTTAEWCRLYLALDKQGQVAAAIGLEHLPCEHEGRPVRIGCASNFVAFAKGAGGYLFLHWVRSSEVSCIYGGSEDTHRILRSQRWTYFPGVRIHRLNGRFETRPADPPWRRAAKAVLRAVTRGVDVRAAAERAAAEPQWRALAVEEVRVAAPDMLPAGDAFAFRMRPTVDYLNWRYRTDLPFVRYRMFRLTQAGDARGYVILNERPRQWLVAQADAADPAALAGGILLALGAAARTGDPRREVVLACAHRRMAACFEHFGLVPGRADRPFALSAGRQPLDWSPDTSNWLVNFDWTDNGLRPPFLDEEAPGLREARATSASGVVQASRYGA